MNSTNPADLPAWPPSLCLPSSNQTSPWCSRDRRGSSRPGGTGCRLCTVCLVNNDTVMYTRWMRKNTGFNMLYSTFDARQTAWYTSTAARNSIEDGWRTTYSSDTHNKIEHTWTNVEIYLLWRQLDGITAVDSVLRRQVLQTASSMTRVLQSASSVTQVLQSVSSMTQVL